MTDLKILLKYDFMRFISAFRGKTKKRSAMSAIILLALAVLGIFVLYFFQSYAMFRDLHVYNLDKLCLFLGISIGLTVLIIFAVMRTTGNSWGSDSEFLMSMPINRRVIVISKVISLYFFDFVISFLTLIPCFVNYQIFSGFSLTTTIIGLFIVILLPLLSLGITYIMDFLVVRLFNRTKYSKLFKTLFALIIYLAVLALLYAKTFTMSSVTFENMEAFFSDRPISKLLMMVAIEPNFVRVILALALTTFPFVIGFIAYCCNFGKSFEKFANKSKVLKYTSCKSSFLNLLNKEKSTYFSCPAYVINTILSPIMILVGSIVAVILIDKTIIVELTTFESFFSMDMIAGIIIIVFCMINALGCISCSSISIEGKSIWILKSMPINERQLFLSKALFHIFVQEPAVIIGAIICTAFFNLNLLQSLMIFIIPTLFVVIFGFLGIVINLWVPKLDWDNENQVCKSSLAVFLSLIFGLIITLIPVALFLIFTKLSIIWLFGITVVIYLSLLVFTISFLMTKGVNIFKKLS